MKGLKIIAMNLLIFFALLGFANYGTVGIYKLKEWVFSVETSTRQTSKLVSTEWALQHIREYKQALSTYRDFIGWSRQPFKGQTIHIGEDGLRVTPQPLVPAKATVWLFGGSTVWGTGTGDNETIPAYLALNHDYDTRNMGIGGYLSRQGVNSLMNQLSEHSAPDFVIFYDGINDVFARCQQAVGSFGTDREHQIRKRLELSPKTFQWQLHTPVTLAEQFISTDQNSSQMNCNKDTIKARWAATYLVNNWKYAKAITEAAGAKFAAILQPVSFFSTSNTDHLTSKDNKYKAQYEAVYPLVREVAKLENFEIIDFTDALNQQEDYFYDFMHINPNGNAIIAERIANELAIMR